MVVVGGAVLFLVARRSNSEQLKQSCINNLRTLGEAIDMYAQANDGLVPPYTNMEKELAARTRSAAPTASSQPKLLRDALRIYTDEASWYCPLDPVGKQKKYYLGIRHEFTSYAFPIYTTKEGQPASLNDIPAKLQFGLVWDAAGRQDSCEQGLWFAGSAEVASNHPDGKVNVVLSDLSLPHQIPNVFPDGKTVP